MTFGPLSQTNITANKNMRYLVSHSINIVRQKHSRTGMIAFYFVQSFTKDVITSRICTVVDRTC
jgi:hypothetical protein